jgi:hypothetical protein
MFLYSVRGACPRRLELTTEHVCVSLLTFSDVDTIANQLGCMEPFIFWFGKCRIGFGRVDLELRETRSAAVSIFDVNLFSIQSLGTKTMVYVNNTLHSL